MTTITSGKIVLPRVTALSSCSFTFLRRASFSRLTPSAFCSGSLSILAIKNGSVWVKESARTLLRPWTSILTRPSGSFSIRMIMHTVPTEYRSSGDGASTLMSFWLINTTMRLVFKAWSIALMEISLPTNSGIIIYGKTTISLTGSTGSDSGISTSFSVTSSYFSASFISLLRIDQFPFLSISTLITLPLSLGNLTESTPSL